MKYTNFRYYMYFQLNFFEHNDDKTFGDKLKRETTYSADEPSEAFQIQPQ